MNSVVRALATALMAGVIFAASAQAATITGEIGFGGIFTPTGGTGLADATGLEVTNSVVLSQSQSGDFTSIAGGTTVDWTPLTFAPPDLPVTPLWLIDLGFGNTFEFNLETVMVLEQTDSTLVLEGTGTLLATGFDDTAGVWSFNSNSGDLGGVFIFTSNNTAQVPVPATLLLVGVGLVAMAGRRRIAKAS